MPAATMPRRAPRPITSSRGAFSTITARPRRWRPAASWRNWDARANQLTVWDTTQAPVFLRNGLAGMLGLSERQVRVIAPFVGGGFGPKIMMFYPEEVLIPWAARKLNRPVKWIEDRLEHFFATTHERGQIHDAEIALIGRRPYPRRQGRVSARHRRLRSLRTDGADQSANARCSDPMWCRTTTSTFTAVFTNKPIVTPYRGAGRQHGVFVIERLLDIAAHELEASIAPRSAGAISFRRTRFRTTTRSSIRTSRRSNTTAAITSRCSTRRWR